MLLLYRGIPHMLNNLFFIDTVLCGLLINCNMTYKNKLLTLRNIASFR